MIRTTGAPRIGFGVVVALLFLLFLYSPWSYRITELPSKIVYSQLNKEPGESKRSEAAVTNGTLGFQKVFAVGLPERSDKRDALALISGLTGFKIDWIEGVRGTSVPDKALPFGVDRVKLWESNLGSWRGHMNAIRTIVEEGITSALIMEDDMDWDVRLKSQLATIAKGTRYLQDSKSAASINSPYGDDWDVLWLGHCGEIFPETLPEYKDKDPSDPYFSKFFDKFVIHPDETVPEPEFTAGFQNYTQNPHTRWVHVSGGPICTFAYAVSQQGARKILYDLSVDHLVGPFDNALAGLCRWGAGEDRYGMKCFSVTPPVFMHHRSKGWTEGDSDIQGQGAQKNPAAGKGNLRTVGTTENMVYSARLNIKEMLTGMPMRNQFVAQ